MQIVKHRKIYFTLSGLLLLGSLVSLLFWGLSFGIDFTGGSLMEVEYSKERPSNQEIQEKLSVLDLAYIE